MSLGADLSEISPEMMTLESRNTLTTLFAILFPVQRVSLLFQIRENCLLGQARLFYDSADLPSRLIQVDTYPITLDPSSITGSATNRVPLDQLGNITRSMWGMVVPNVTVSLVKSAGEAETLAQPQLRITEGEKGNLVIGDKVPIPTTTFNTSQTIGGNVVPITAFQYQDVGIKIDVEPRVHHNNEVTLKLKVEVSELGENVRVSRGADAAEDRHPDDHSMIRLKDGETSLSRRPVEVQPAEDQAGIPWLSDMPVIGGLFRELPRDQEDRPDADLDAAHRPQPRHHRGGPRAGVGRHREPHHDLRQLAEGAVAGEQRVQRARGRAGLRRPRRLRPARAGGHGGARAGGPGGEQQEPAPVQPDNRRRLTFPRPPGAVQTPPNPGQSDTPDDGNAAQSVDAPAVAELASPVAAGGSSDAFPADTAQLPRLSFYPARLPVKIGGEAQLSVVLDPGVAGLSSPVHVAYDPARLRVTRVDGGELGGASGAIKVTATHTPALGWVTLSWSGTALTSGTALRLNVSPLALGELSVILAGPIGEIVSRPGTVVSLPQTPMPAVEQ